MVLGKYVLAIDQGNDGTTVILFDRQSEMVGKVYQEFTQYYPKPGWWNMMPWNLGWNFGAWSAFFKKQV